MSSYREAARVLRLMAHPMRLEILAIVRRSDECVCHLAAALEKPQPYVSQQLAILRNEGLIEDHKEGTNVYYGLAAGCTGDQVAAILAALDCAAPGCAAPSCAQSRHRVNEVHTVVAGCNCPKCVPGGTCSPAGDRVHVLDQAQCEA